MEKAEILKALNSDLEYEMSAMIRYLHHSFAVAGPGRGPLVGLFRARARDCMDHATKLGEKITVMGGKASVNIQDVQEPAEPSIEEMLKENLDAERQHLKLYEEQLELVKDNPSLRVFIEQFIVDETAHVEELEMYLRHASKVAATV
jgi:bacterioferritin